MRHRHTIPRLTGPFDRTLTHRGYDVLPEIGLVADGELFAGTWIVRRCLIGTATRDGYEVRALGSDNDHFRSRRDALRMAFFRAARTIDLDEVRATHLSSLPSSVFQ